MRRIRSRSRAGGTTLLIVATALFFVACAGARDVRDVVTPISPSGPSQSTWLTYANQQYGLTLQYPATYTVTVVDKGLEPNATLRIAFQLASLVRPTGMEPPQFAVDVFSNPSRSSVEAWLAANGATSAMKRPVQDAVQVGGVQGIRVVDQILLAPNTFYFVVRGAFVYRFTPLGAYSDEMLKSVQFTS
jgi:hypothetical protein